MSRERSAFGTVQKEIMGRGRGVVEGAIGGEGMTESFKMELEEKRGARRFCFVNRRDNKSRRNGRVKER